MGTVLLIALGVFLLIGSQQRAAILASIGTGIQDAGKAVSNAATGEGEIPYGGGAGYVPNSSGFNPDPGLEVTYIGGGGQSAGATTTQSSAGASPSAPTVLTVQKGIFGEAFTNPPITKPPHIGF